MADGLPGRVDYTPALAAPLRLLHGVGTDCLTGRETTGGVILVGAVFKNSSWYADIPDIDVLPPRARPVANQLLAKGVGDLGVCDSGAAVANAIHNATGVRVRSFPITLDKLFPDIGC